MLDINKPKLKRKLNKLKRDPARFVFDSKAYLNARRSAYYTWAKLGSFAIVVLAAILVIIYYLGVASPRYVSVSQFVVKQGNSTDVPVFGLASLGSASPSTRDALIVKEYIQSRDMALQLDKALALKRHYEDTKYDIISRLERDSSTEAYLDFYKKHINIKYDEMSEIISVEVQTFNAEYSLHVAETILKISEQFINKLGQNMVEDQLRFAQEEVQRAYQEFKKTQADVVKFQDENNIFSPEQHSSALVGAINELESKIIAAETELKSLMAYMQSDSSAVKSKNIELNSLNKQLEIQKARLTSHDQSSLNKIHVDYQDLTLNAKLASDLYQTSLVSLEKIRTEAFRKLKHFLIIENPALAEEDKYPRRLYNIITFLTLLLAVYGIARFAHAVIKEHS
ncbi:lipopolysaccharide biosynthesis protein [Flocculibacter collagenilyticus]|uniref:lipopolysaccharide biosynthesis protein n=1 Tax=Flocculibacter collagenilyticus TaxID=2744479 RepID=UPI001F37FAAB|nr:lipopolysaccharide biosynthesis protein [Flocculibacter collagenilyticus]